MINKRNSKHTQNKRIKDGYQKVKVYNLNIETRKFGVEPYHGGIGF